VSFIERVGVPVELISSQLGVPKCEGMNGGYIIAITVELLTPSNGVSPLGARLPDAVFLPFEATISSSPRKRA
jgi:hypothetical protein